MRRSILLAADIVESVRLMAVDEWGSVARWVDWLERANAQVLPPWGGRFVASLGDGALFAFEKADAALGAAQNLLRLAERVSLGAEATQSLHLRIGLHDGLWCEIDGAVLGEGLEAVQAVAALAEPDEWACSREFLAGLSPLARDSLREVRRAATGGGTVWVPPPAEPWRAPLAPEAIRPRLAVLMRTPSGALRPGFAEVLLHDLGRVLARQTGWQVVSTETNGPVLQDAASEGRLAKLLQVDWIAWLDIAALSHDRHLVQAVLRRASDGHAITELASEVDVDELLAASERFSLQLAQAVRAALWHDGELLAMPVALHRFDAYSLLMQSIGAAYAASPTALVQSRQMLDHLRQRHPRASEVAAWNALWHVYDQTSMRTPVARSDGEDERALDAALRLDDAHPLALAALAHWELKIGLDLDRARWALERGLEHGPSESLLWLFKAHWHLRVSESVEAVAAVEQAMRLAPMTPCRFLYDNIAAMCYAENGQTGRGLAHAQRAYQANPWHLNSLVQLLICEVRAGALDAARSHALQYLQHRPNARAGRLLERVPDRARAFVQRQIEDYLAAGIPP